MDLINCNDNSVERAIVFYTNFWICFMKIKTIRIINPVYIWYRFKKPEGFVLLSKKLFDRTASCQLRYGIPF